MSDFRIVSAADDWATWKPKRLVCPLCLEDTATGWCKTCGIDWSDGLSDWLIRPRKDTLGDDYLAHLNLPPERRNRKWRSEWRKRDTLRCSWCDVTDADAPGVKFEIDHVEPIAAGGPDELDNTRVLCVACHRLRATMQAQTRRMRRREP